MEKVDNNNVKIKTMIEDCVVLDDTIWFCAQNFNGLYSMNLITKEVKLCGVFQNEMYSQCRLYATMKLVGRKIFLIPFFAKNIMVYDVDACCFTSIEIDEALVGSQGNMLFMGVQQYKNYLFIIPVQATVIIRLNTVDNSITYIKEWYEECKDILHGNVYFRKQSILLDSKLYVPFFYANAVLELDCDTLKTTIYRIGKEKRGYTGICFDGKKIWLAPTNDRRLVQWDMTSNAVIESSNNSDMKGVENYPYVGIAYYNNNLYAFPIEKDSYEKNSNDTVNIMHGKFTFVKEETNYTVYYESESGILTLIDKVGGGKKRVEIAVDSKQIDMKKFLKESGVETQLLGIKQYIGIILEDYSSFSCI